jgi:hypothetical protein
MGLPLDFEADVPSKTLSMSLNLESTGQKYLEKLQAEDLKYFLTNNQWLNEEQLSEKIEKLTAQ